MTYTQNNSRYPSALRKKIDLKGKILQGLSSEKIYAFSAKISFASTILLIPTRSHLLKLKQLCLGDLTHGICGISIILGAGAIKFVVAVALPKTMCIIEDTGRKSKLIFESLC